MSAFDAPLVDTPPEPPPAAAAARPSGAVPPPVANDYAAAIDPGGIAYITVTDAAGRVLFRRPATAQEVTDALRSADEAHSEGEAAMERIAYDRIFTEIMGELE